MGSAATATALWPGSSTFPGAAIYPGQGVLPIWRCRLSFDDLSRSVPSWTEIAANKLRSFTTSRGRENELSEFDASSATIVLDNRDRSLDPNTVATVTPMNRVWIYEEFSGEVHNIFRGYVESWDQEWPDGGWSDAIATITATDEFKILSLETMPTTSPPRGSYEDVIGADTPTGYWRLNEDPETFTQDASEVEPNPQPPPFFFGRWTAHFLRQGWE